MEISTSDVIAGMALLGTVYTIFSTRNLNKLQGKVLSLEHDLNLILLEKEKNDQLKNKKASLSCNCLKIGSDKKRLKVYNSGEADAYNVRITYPDGLRPFVHDNKFPLEKMNTMQSCEVGVLVYNGFPSKSLITLVWDDENQKNNENEVMVTW